ncbi:RNA exonuclease 1 [Dendrobium catenatum]|uniref:RNA exonuclease 1 n=1 Tax=Dendrobium catenatum TaxID=906689 RepID=A0A2I0X8K0_9ASPA|nr:RNA exonuclease 1 [Dendrobium catenatum]
MDALSSLSFPPLNPLSTSKTHVPSKLERLWSSIAASPEPVLDSLPVSLIETPEVIVPFNKDYTAAAALEWKLSLVGYSVGKRPYYEALLSTAKRIWKLKGTFQLITLSDGFFLFKFSNAEDYEMVWSKGAWFFHGKPFVFQKWSKDFQPTRENFSMVLIWVRIIDLPLVCWNSEGISKIASKIGTPLSVDALTAAKTRLTHARVCIQVATTSAFPETVSISIEDVVFHLKIQYEWKPNPCATCKSMAHTSSHCPSNPQPPQQETQPPRGRSTSRNHRRQHTSQGPTSQTRSFGAAPKQTITSTASTTVLATSSLGIVPTQVTFPSAQATGSQNSQEIDTGIVTASTSGIIVPMSILALTIPVNPPNITIPNLNSPTDECIANLEQESTSSFNNPPIPTKNQFDSLQNCEEQGILEGVDHFTQDAPTVADETNIQSSSNTTSNPLPKSTKGKGAKKPPTPKSKSK